MAEHARVWRADQPLKVSQDRLVPPELLMEHHDQIHRMALDLGRLRMAFPQSQWLEAAVAELNLVQETLTRAEGGD